MLLLWIICMNYQAVIFDLDGTLLNTVEDIAFAMNTVLRRHNLPTFSVTDYHHFIGGGLTNLVYQTVPESIRKQEDLMDTYLAELINEYSKCIDQHTKPYTGIYELLDKLMTKNILLAILSNKDHQFMGKTIATHFAKWSFTAVFGARPGIPSKPNPQGALEIAAIMQLEPNQIAYVGDSDVDMQTATRAGMYPVGVLWGFRSKNELLHHGAKLVIEHPNELLKIF